MSVISDQVWNEASQNLKTVRDWVRFAVSAMTQGQVFLGHGSDNAYDEAVYLVQKAIHLPVEHIDGYMNAVVLPSEQKTLLSWIQQRVEQRIPTAYLAKQAWLQGHPFYVDQRVIIPRSFIAELLADGLYPWVEDTEAYGSILDLCTGSGCLAILAALTFPHAQVDAVDKSKDALEVANINIEQYHLKHRVRTIESDLLNNPVLSQYDLIISNPPYVNAQSMASLPGEYLAEPNMALAAGHDGMDLIRIIIAQAKSHLKPGGKLIIELGNEKPYFDAAFADLNVTWLSVSAGDEQVFMVDYDDLPDVTNS